MAGRFVRASKYRHVFGRPTRREQCFDNIKVSKNAWDSNILKANPEYIAVNYEAGGGGAFAVIPVDERGRLPERFPLFRGHTAVVLDTDWNPFNDSLIASGSDDGKIFLWRVPDGFKLHTDTPADEVKDIAPVGKLPGHPKKVGQVLFNPAAENILASAAGDYTVKIWDIESGSAKLSLKVGDVVQGLSWSANGSLLVTTSRDKKLRIWDARQEKPAHEGPSHAGAKNSRCVWLGEHDRIATTGFSRMSDRQLALWDIKAAREPVGGFEQLDSISGVCMPFWDEGTQCLYLAGKGDGNIRYFEYENDKFEYLSEYKSADPQRGVAFVPKRGVNMHENEVTRAYKTVNDAYIEPISFIVPRRSETFQDDIYPATVGLKPALSAAAWFEGKEGLPPKIDMQSLYDGDGMKEVPSDIQPAAAVAKAAKEEQVTKAQQVKDAEPLKTAEAAESAPIVTAIKGPPPSMKEQGATMMTAVDKYADKDGEREEEDDDASSFEEVQKPVERTTATRPATAKIEAAEPALTIEQPIPVEPEKPKDLQAHEDSVAAKETNVAPSSTSVGTPDESSGGIEREMKNMKAILAQQSRQISSQGEEIKKLTEQIQALTSKLQ